MAIKDVNNRNQNMKILTVFIWTKTNASPTVHEVKLCHSEKNFCS